MQLRSRLIPQSQNTTENNILKNILELIDKLALRLPEYGEEFPDSSREKLLDSDDDEIIILTKDQTKEALKAILNQGNLNLENIYKNLKKIHTDLNTKQDVEFIQSILELIFTCDPNCILILDNTSNIPQSLDKFDDEVCSEPFVFSSSALLIWCAFYLNNLKLLQYVVETRDRSLEDSIQLCFVAASCNNIELIQYIVNTVGLEEFRQEMSEDRHSIWELFKNAAETQNPAVFNYVMKCFGDLLDNSTLATLLGAAIQEGATLDKVKDLVKKYPLIKSLDQNGLFHCIHRAISNEKNVLQYLVEELHATITPDQFKQLETDYNPRDEDSRKTLNLTLEFLKEKALKNSGQEFQDKSKEATTKKRQMHDYKGVATAKDGFWQQNKSAGANKKSKVMVASVVEQVGVKPGR